MSFFNKFYFRNFLFYSLILGAFWSIQPVIDFGWNEGILVGVVYGVLIGLILANILTEDFSKPVYPLDVERSHLSAEDVQSDFQPQMRGYYWFILLVGLFCIPFIMFSLLFNDITFLLYLPLPMMLGLSAVVYRRFSRIYISQDGIEYRSILFRMKMTWEIIESIEKRGRTWFLIYQPAEIYTIPIFRNLLKVYEVDRRLNLSSFTNNFLESEMAKAIFFYAKQIAVLSTG
jgi:hypothetical protein